MPRKISKSDREVQLSALALADGYEFVGWVGEYVGNTTRAIFKCAEHGTWDCYIGNFVSHGSRCAGCSNQFVYSQEQQVERLSALASSDGYEFVSWMNGYHGVHSRAIIRCTDHGEWDTSVNNFVNRGHRCQRCKGAKMSADRRIPEIDRKCQLMTLAETDGYEFIGWKGEYTNDVTLAIFRCADHGEWSCRINNFVNSGTRCPSCAVTGYRPSCPGTLYALLSDCGAMVKIGISNKSHKRYADLRRNTPFKFSIHREIHCDDGAVPIMLERLFHNQFPSADCKGFDGATEWRQMSSDITTWLELLK